MTSGAAGTQPRPCSSAKATLLRSTSVERRRPRVRRALAHAGRSAIEDVGGPLRRDRCTRRAIEQAWDAACKVAQRGPRSISLGVAGMHARSTSRWSDEARVATSSTCSTTVGDTGTAQAALLLASGLERAKPGQTIAIVSLADGADVLIFKAERATTPKRTVQAQIDNAAPTSHTHGSSRGAAWSRPSRRTVPNPLVFPRPRPSVVRTGSSVSWTTAVRSLMQEDDRDIHRRPPRVLTEPADRVRDRRLRRQDPAPTRAHRR